MEIKETIVVEGKSDVIKLSNFIKANFIITNGTHLSKTTLKLIEKAQASSGVIIFTDPDYPGNYIRNKINETIPGCKNAFIIAEQARDKNKVGVEHADKETIMSALAKLVTYEKQTNRFNLEQLRNLGLIGSAKSNRLRRYVGAKLSIGQCNGKTFLKRLNMLDVDYEVVKDLVQQGVSDE